MYSSQFLVPILLLQSLHIGSKLPIVISPQFASAVI